MLVNRLTHRMLLQTKLFMRFSGGHHETVYDWRDDHAKNIDLYDDPRMVGVRPAHQFVTPYETNVKLQFAYTHPANYDQKNLAVNLTGNNNFTVIQNEAQVPHTSYLADAAHEYDYESEDLDYQPESFQSQHFRKQGPLWMWIIVGTLPLTFIGNELFYQYWPDVDNWRYQRPAPLNYPDEDDTPDNLYSRMFKSQAHKDLHDAGAVGAPFFTIKDGKKVYSQWAGVNDPRQPI